MIHGSHSRKRGMSGMSLFDYLHRKESPKTTDKRECEHEGCTRIVHSTTVEPDEKTGQKRYQCSYHASRYYRTQNPDLGKKGYEPLEYERKTFPSLGLTEVEKLEQEFKEAEKKRLERVRKKDREIKQPLEDFLKPFLDDIKKREQEKWEKEKERIGENLKRTDTKHGSML